MRDTLDLQELRDRIAHYKELGRKRRNRSITYTVFAVILWLWFYGQFGDNIGYVYTQVDGEWVESEGDLQSARFLRSDNGDTLWMQTIYPDTMVKIQSDSWTVYNPDEEYTCCASFAGAFDTHDGVLRLADEGDGLFFNGKRWNITHDWLPTEAIEQLALSDYLFLAIDTERIIHVVDDTGEWRVTNLPEMSPDTQLTAVGYFDDMYIIHNGIWLYNFDTDSWNSMQAFDRYTLYLGIDHDLGELWFVDGEYLIRYDHFYEDITRFPLSDMGLNDRTDYIEIFYDDYGTYLVTSKKIIQIDDESWEVQSVPERTEHGISGVGVTPDGNWLIASTNYDLYQLNQDTGGLYILGHLFAEGSFLIIILVLVIIWLSPFSKHQQARAERSKKLLFAVFPELPLYQRIQPSFDNIKWGRWILLGFAYLVVTTIAVGVVGAVMVSVTDIDANLYSVISAVMIVIVIPAIYFVYRMLRRSGHYDEPTANHRWRKVRLILVGIGIFIAYFGAIELFVSVLLPPIIPDENARAILRLIIALAYPTYWVLTITYRQRNLFPKGFAQSDYDTALKVVEKQRDGLLYTASRMSMHGSILYFMGRYEEAYDVYIGAIAEQQNNPTSVLSVFMMDLSSLLEVMGNLDRAMIAYQARIAMLPENAGSYLGLVNSYNDRRVYPERAIELGEEMMSHLSDKPNAGIYTPIYQSLMYGAYAVALAQAGRSDEAQVYLDKMYANSDEKLQPYYVRSLRSEACVRIAQGKLEEAIQLLNKAIALDPHGHNAKVLRDDLDYIASL